MAAKKKKAKWKWLRYRKGDHAHNMVCAAQHWIHENGGTAIVLGRIGVMHEGNMKYQVCLSALGVAPTKKKETK